MSSIKMKFYPSVKSDYVLYTRYDGAIRQCKILEQFLDDNYHTIIKTMIAGVGSIDVDFYKISFYYTDEKALLDTKILYDEVEVFDVLRGLGFDYEYGQNSTINLYYWDGEGVRVKDFLAYKMEIYNKDGEFGVKFKSGDIIPFGLMIGSGYNTFKTPLYKYRSECILANKPKVVTF